MRLTFAVVAALMAPSNADLSAAWNIGFAANCKSKRGTIGEIGRVQCGSNRNIENVRQSVLRNARGLCCLRALNAAATRRRTNLIRNNSRVAVVHLEKCRDEGIICGISVRATATYFCWLCAAAGTSGSRRRGGGRATRARAFYGILTLLYYRLRRVQHVFLEDLCNSGETRRALGTGEETATETEISRVRRGSRRSTGGVALPLSHGYH